MIAVAHTKERKVLWTAYNPLWVVRRADNDNNLPRPRKIIAYWEGEPIYENTPRIK